MTLHLSVPAMEDKPLIPAEMRPKVLEGLLAALPGHPASAAHALQEQLALLNRQAVRSDIRLKLLELYRPAALNIVHGLAPQYCGQTLPLSKTAEAAAETARTLLAELAFGYKLAILDHVSRVFTMGRGKTLALLIQRAIHALDQQLLVSYYTYTSAPEGVWSEIHRLYLYAAQHGVHDTEVLELVGRASVDLTYKGALLLALANPQRLVSADVDRVRDYLARFAHLVQIYPLGTPENPAGVFLVRLKSDSPAMPLAKLKGEADMRTDILLVTVELARQVNSHLTALQENQPPARLGLPEGVRAQHYEDLFAHLLKHWALAPKRTFPRQSKNESINLCVGLAAAHYFLNGGSDRFAGQSEGGDDTVSLNFAGRQAHGVAAADDGNKRRYDTARWLVVNESAGGMALSKFPGVSSSLRVGELLGLRGDRSEKWGLGAVRWAGSGDSGELEIGAQMLAPSAKAVSVRPDGTGNFDRALLLPELAPLKQAATLVTACGVYHPARVLEVAIEANATPLRVLATKLVERTNSFERFQFSPL